MAALPSLSKAYSTRRDIPLPAEASQSDIRRSYIWLRAACLLDIPVTGTISGARTAANTWTCYYSCDGTTAGAAGDGVNHWTDYTKVVQAGTGSAHSWIVLYNATLGLYRIIDANNATNNLRESFSKVAPTGGTTTSGPVTTNGWVSGITSADSASNVAPFIGDDTVTSTHYVNYTVSDDGKQEYFLMARSGLGVFSGISCVNYSDGAHVSDTHPIFSTRHTSVTARGAGAKAVLISAAGFSSRGYDDSTITTSGGASEPGRFGGSIWVSALGVDTLSSNYPTWAIELGATVPGPVIRGTIPDFFYIATAPVGAGILVGGVQQYLVVGDAAMPFVGDVPTL